MAKERRFDYLIIDLSACIPLQWANIKKWGRGSGGQFHTNHCILSTRASTWCLCLQGFGKGLLLYFHGDTRWERASPVRSPSFDGLLSPVQHYFTFHQIQVIWYRKYNWLVLVYFLWRSLQKFGSWLVLSYYYFLFIYLFIHSFIYYFSHLLQNPLRHDYITKGDG